MKWTTRGFCTYVLGYGCGGRVIIFIMRSSVLSNKYKCDVYVIHENEMDCLLCVYLCVCKIKTTIFLTMETQMQTTGRNADNITCYWPSTMHFHCSRNCGFDFHV